MSDLIDRAAAIEALEEKYFSFGIFREQRAASQCIDVIKNLPSAQPERKTGQWEPFSPKYHWYSCSLCGQWSDRLRKYCPSCGARMEVEEDA